MTGKGPTPVNVVQRSRRRLANLVQQQPAQGGWFRVLRNDAGTGPTRVDIYAEIGGGGWFNEGVSAIDFVAQLAAIDGDLEVHINSPGGDCFDGLAIYNALAQRRGNVTTIVDGLAASAASFIAMAGKTRLVCPGAMFMIHEASGLCIGNAADMRELAELLDKISENIADIYADRSGRADGWRDAMQKESWYTADEAVAAGLAHRLAQRPEESALARAAAFDLSAYQHPPRMADAPAGTRHGPFTGSHSHAHAAFGDQGDDAAHEHKHSHDGDADHHHTHADGADAKANAVAALIAAGYRHDHVLEALGLESMPVTAKALAVHHTATEDSAWDGPAAVKAMPNDDTVLEYCHAWQSDEAAATPHKEGDDDADDKKSNYRFPHHRTKGGPANLAACRNGLARLPGADIPDGDRAGVKAHLQAHLDDAKDDGDADDHAPLPAWLTNHDQTPPLPAWLLPAQEAK